MGEAASEMGVPQLQDLSGQGANLLIGYARTSTGDQEAGYETQNRDLEAAGAEKVFSERLSSLDIGARDQLATSASSLKPASVRSSSKFTK
jgi:Resolvase, N terminal domain